MTAYETAQALRMALEQRLLDASTETGVSLDRLRRRVVFERVVSRLEYAEPGRWVLKGGMALEVRLHDGARLTKDLDLGLRDEVASALDLHERLIEALTVDKDGDRFEFATGLPVRMSENSGGKPTWRTKVVAGLAGREFGRLQIDISPRAHELVATERVTLPNSLGFANFPASTVEIIDVHRPPALANAVRRVWSERDRLEPPAGLPPLPTSWLDRYERPRSRHVDLPGSYGSRRPDVGDMFPERGVLTGPWPGVSWL